MRQTCVSDSNAGLPLNSEITFSTLKKIYLYYQNILDGTELREKNRSIKIFIQFKRKNIDTLLMVSSYIYLIYVE